MALSTSRQELLLPVKPAFIALTLVAALLANLLPWSGWMLWVVPDFVALIVLYWCIEEPRKIGFFTAWCLGLLMDIADGSLFGQHALAYSILAYAGIVLHRRVQRFSMAPQILHVIPLLLLTSLIVLLVRVLAGADFPGYAYFLGSFTGAALWPMLSYLLKLPQRPRPDPDRV
ncbi:MAG: rod shape-determining protein MreD [Betaproteobacteria bacterium]|jgi:rod shape-determining protein MreD|nr:rod shape-determining protein MreD [Betaproteobacteria bacterium]MDH5343101.1 rod shape-determining protein MreD [Betaproteobacteria bacterium]